MLRRRVTAPVEATPEAPAELLDVRASVWSSFDASRAWCVRQGLSNGPAGWSAMAMLTSEGRHQVAAEWWAINSGHYVRYGNVKTADWGYLKSAQVPHTVQRRLRRRLDGIEITADDGLRRSTHA